jgi:hypothetical protein
MLAFLAYCNKEVNMHLGESSIQFYQWSSEFYLEGGRMEQGLQRVQKEK